MIVPVQFAECEISTGGARKPGQCGTCTKCGKVARVALDPLDKGKVKQQKEARRKALEQLVSGCEVRHPGGVPPHVDRMIPKGVSLWFKFPGNGRYFECGWNGSDVTFAGGVAATGVELIVIAEKPVHNGAASVLVTELVKKKYWRARIGSQEQRRAVHVQNVWDEVLS